GGAPKRDGPLRVRPFRRTSVRPQWGCCGVCVPPFAACPVLLLAPAVPLLPVPPLLGAPPALGVPFALPLPPAAPLPPVALVPLPVSLAPRVRADASPPRVP